MAMSVVYTNFLGGIVAENRGRTHSVYVADNLGSTVALMNSSGAVTDTWTYWPYGEIQTRTGSTATPFTFCGVLGYLQDLANNMIYVRARFLRLALARWHTVDPLRPKPGISAYVYAGNDPMMSTDMLGLFVLPVMLGSALAGCAGSVIGGLIGNFFDPSDDPAFGCKEAMNCLSGAVAGLGLGIAVGTLGGAVALGCIFGALAGVVSAFGNAYCDGKYGKTCPNRTQVSICNALAQAASGCAGGAIGGVSRGLPVSGHVPGGDPPRKPGALDQVINGLIATIADRFGAACSA